MTRPRIDLNGDVGESYGVYTLGHDERIIPSLSSVNVACGFHAGDPAVMRRTVRLALEHGVVVGAHPGFPDLVGFGRRSLGASASEVEDLVLYQVGALAGIVAAEGGRLAHVKPHGALYNMAAADRVRADAVARAVASFDRQLILFGLAGSHLLDAGRDVGLRVAAEVFADRAYDAEGCLVERSVVGAVIDDPAAVVARATEMVLDGRVTALTGETIHLTPDTLCVHGDTLGAVNLAAGIRTRLEASGVSVEALRLAAP